MNPPTRGHTYTHVVEFRAVHRIKSLPPSHPEARIHGHLYRAEIECNLDAEHPLTTTQEEEVAVAVESWVGSVYLPGYLHGEDLTTLNFPTVPGNLAAHIWDWARVALTDILDPGVVTGVTVTVDGRHRYRFGDQ